MTRDRSPSEYLRENGDRQFFLVFFTRYDHTKNIKNLYAGGCIISKNDTKLGIWNCSELRDNVKTVHFSYIFLRSGNFKLLNWKIIAQKM